MEYVWKIEKMTCYPMLDEKPNVVFNVDWSITGKNETNSAKMTGTQYVDFSASKNFVAYEQLTEDRVLDWVFNAMSAQKIENLKKEIDRTLQIKKEPTIVVNSLPWL
jgi:hypothetical protein